jgi:hypothetical protein
MAIGEPHPIAVVYCFRAQLPIVQEIKAEGQCLLLGWETNANAVPRCIAQQSYTQFAICNLQFLQNAIGNLPPIAMCKLQRAIRKNAMCNSQFAI